MAPSVNTHSAATAASQAPGYGKSGFTTVEVQTDKVRVADDAIYSTYAYENAVVEKVDGKYKVKPTVQEYEFKLDTKVPKTGLLLVGLGGNNGSTLTAAVTANRHNISFNTKNGKIEPNYFGSVTQAATIKLGIDANGKDVYAPFNEIVPLLHPNDFVIGGWDISKLNLAGAMQRAQVLDYDLQRQLVKHLEQIVPLPSIYYPDFIAANQSERADNLIPGEDKWAHVEHIRKDIREFKEKNDLDKVIVLWTANTERYADIIEGVNDTADNLLKAVKESHSEVSPSTIFAIASILEGVPYINGSPQNTFVPGCIELAEKHNAFIGGDDFKSGQTKLKSVLAQYLVDAGIRPVSVASYNHLGNNDGYNLSAPKQFRSKEISKASVIDDMIESNQILYNDKYGKTVDHCIVIKYVPAVGDSKVAMDEYHSELMLGGHNTVSIHNVCEDSLLATPLIIDLVVVSEFLSRVTYKKKNSEEDYHQFHSVLSFLSYWLKAPLTRPGFDPVNGLNKQRAGLENLIRGLVGLAPHNDLKLEERTV
ncbi:inositol-3-phosphate synthase INO1 [Sugiyamaella lignohabitans]|uniref:Inositol-3-phosphate synthase n=1 Tax=Sugiyamaella lignohabitans TaxID=796027 RepID=A0A161HEZ3_9ASCO|nr:inositol-3-phosphate synthase INO1 [Sugiyamaella lignohabitans]ANB10961.1 inositol-3-phosphate synthase INO1 [Sugiyamaella lignohabitans]